MSSRPSHDQVWLETARTLARRATCLRKAVGCVLVNARHEVIATGYNGVAHGMSHCNDSFLLPNDPHTRAFLSSNPSEEDIWRKMHPHACQGARAPSGTSLEACEAIHAEQNALLQCRSVAEIHTCYTTHSPCITCTKLLLNTGCQRVIFLEAYAHDGPARALWERSGRIWKLGVGL